MSTHFDGPVVLDDALGSTGYFGFADTAGPRVYGVGSDPNGSLNAPTGSWALRNNGTAYINTGGTTWVAVTGGSSWLVPTDTFFYLGSAQESYLVYNSAFSALRIATSDTDASTASKLLLISTGQTTQAAAAVGANSGNLLVQTGPTDCTIVGGTSGDTGDMTVATGSANATAGTSGNSGTAVFGSGSSADGTSGPVSVRSGDAGGNSGDVSLESGNSTGGLRGTARLAGRTLTLEPVTNQNSALRVLAGSMNFIVVDTTTTAPRVVAGYHASVKATPSTVVDLPGLPLADGLLDAGRVVLSEPFAQRPDVAANVANANANKNFVLTNLTANVSTATFSASGAVQITTDVNAGDGGVFQPHTTANQSTWTSIVEWVEKGATRSFIFATGADITTVVLEVGVRPTPTDFTVAGDDDKYILRFDPASSANWQVVTSNAGVDVVEDTGLVVQANTPYILLTRVSGGTVSFYCWAPSTGRNPILVNTPANHTLAAATALGVPYFGVRTAAGARSFIVTRTTVAFSA